MNTCMLALVSNGLGAAMSKQRFVMTTKILQHPKRGNAKVLWHPWTALVAHMCNMHELVLVDIQWAVAEVSTVLVH